MMYVIGFIVALASIAASIAHLDQSIGAYYDFVALAMVTGGTFAVACMTLPWNLRGEIARGFRGIFKGQTQSRGELLRDCIRVNENAHRGVLTYESSSDHLSQKILRDGVELIQLGISPDKIQPILSERMHQAADRARQVSGAIRGLAKYPPAFGLVGTVLGLVHLMHGVSDGMSPKETGIRMAVALVATFYGLLVANLLVNPIGEAIQKNAVADEKLAEISVQAVLLASEKTNLLEAQEMLNSFVDENERVDVLAGAQLEEVAA